MFILLALALFLTMQANAQESLTCSQNGTLVTFTNGIDTSDVAAKKYLEKIKALLPNSSIDKQGKVDYQLTYNYSEKFATDLYEAFLQKIAVFYKITAIAAAFRYTGIILSTATIPSELGNQLSQITSDVTGSFDIKNDPEYLKTINEHLRIWDNAFSIKKQKIVAVSHSQGGLFINDAYNILMLGRPVKDRNLFAMLQVATPASQINAVNGKGTIMGKHLTNDHDIILVIPSSLRPNVVLSIIAQISDFFAAILAHSFDKIYTKHFTPELQQKLKDVALLLGSNCVCQNPNGSEIPTRRFNNTNGSLGGFVPGFFEGTPGSEFDLANVLADADSGAYIGEDVIVCDGRYFGSDLRGNIKINAPSDISGAIMRTYGTGSIELTDALILPGSSIQATDGKRVEMNRVFMNDGSTVFGGNVLMFNVWLRHVNITADATYIASAPVTAGSWGIVIVDCDVTSGIYAHNRIDMHLGIGDEYLCTYLDASLFGTDAYISFPAGRPPRPPLP